MNLYNIYDITKPKGEQLVLEKKTAPEVATFLGLSDPRAVWNGSLKRTIWNNRYRFEPANDGLTKEERREQIYSGRDGDLLRQWDEITEQIRNKVTWVKKVEPGVRIFGNRVRKH